ncbi:MAG: PHP domain-containing protein [Deltaproteobacteria bacterium]|nr:PHP domain-containing protein [Candidatus Zymogenaceae bacterium]
MGKSVKDRRHISTSAVASSPFRFDLHVHTSIGSPCAFYDPLDIPRYAQAAGLTGVVITEHNFGWAENALGPAAYDNLGGGFSERGLLMLVGMEVSTTEGDVLVYPPDIAGLIGALPGGFGRLDFTVDEVMAAADRLGALAVLAHPHTYPKTMPHAIERFNGARGAFYNPYGVPEVGGSDAHFPWGVGAAYTEFEQEIANIEDLICLVKEGKCRPGRRRDE